MKYIFFLFIFIAIVSVDCLGQKMSLADLTSLCDKKNWEDVNRVLLTKGWTYYDSQKGDTYKYNTITWSFNKDYYSDDAEGWVHLYTYEDFPNKITYYIFNKESYTAIQNSLSATGFKLVNSEIEDSKVISTYANASYTLMISTENRKDDENWSSSNSIIAYSITLIKKSGIYDADNGKKADYFLGGLVKSEYTLLNGKLNGQVKSYFLSGQLRKIGNYTNGIENGLFKEYSNDGYLETEYSMLNGELNGLLKLYYPNGNLRKSVNYLNGSENGSVSEYDEYGNKELEYVVSYGKKNGLLKVYEDGKISYSINFLNDSRNGQYIEYYYNEVGGDLQLKLLGEYINNDKNGTWKLYLIEGGKERILKYENYTYGVLNGQFQDVQGDSLIVGSYKNDLLHGSYSLYRDVKRFLFGNVITTNISDLNLISEGNYYEGLKSGHWKNYDLTKTLISEGRYFNGKQSGEWKYYYTKWVDGDNKALPYSEQLFLVENYSLGKLHGKSVRYSYLDEEKYPCPSLNGIENSLDTCSKLVYQRVLETEFYVDGKLNGAYELRDSTNVVLVKGSYKDDLMDGEWTHRYSSQRLNGEIYYFYQKGNYSKDKREGQWVEYYDESRIARTFNYRNDELHGIFTEWNRFNRPREKKQFSFGKLRELITYDSLGYTQVLKYEIYDEKINSYRCRKTSYLNDGNSSQEYWVSKNGKNELELNHVFFEIVFGLATEFFSEEPTGYKDGVYKLVNSRDQPIVIGKFFKEHRVDLWSFYFYDQDVKIESNYTKNEKIDEKYYNLDGELFSGDFVYFDDENGIKEIRKVKDGLRNGNTTYIDVRTNKTLRKESYKSGVLK